MQVFSPVFILFILLLGKAYSQRNVNFLTMGAKLCILSMLICSLFSYPMQKVANGMLFYFFMAIIASQVKPVFNIGSYPGIVITILFVSIVLFVEIIQMNRFVACRKWQKGFEYAKVYEQSRVLDAYQDVYSKLEYDPDFLFNYGVVLIDMYEFEKSVTVLDQCLTRKPSYNLFLKMAKVLENLDQDERAESLYKNAYYLIPHRFVPRDCLFKLYVRTNQDDKALLMAKEIAGLKMKIYSVKADKIKTQALKYLYEHNNYEIDTEQQ